ncbi:PX domain-containing protein YPT35 [Candida viswanathii]|uniref:Endosomal/vacuolar adapter protein YPT35 n=1 Tax=Candida viswanathii TaxID=5486 RepID=A0A367YGA5_9ASCO|nr:PX domain-containing protein YPT35 [Candida viswanathii]
MSRDKSHSVSQLNKVLPVPIELNHGETLETHQLNHLNHITNVLVGEYHLISGEFGKSYISWQIKITINDLDYSSIILYKRYNDIYQLRQDLLHVFQGSKDVNIPDLPPKDTLSVDRFLMSKNWLEDRRKGLQWFLSNVLLDPVFQNCNVVKSFVLSH